MKRKIIFIISLICCIIMGVCIYVIASADDLVYEFKEVNVGSHSYYPMTDAMAFHFNIVDYRAKDGETGSNVLHGPLIEESDNLKMKGYGRYHFTVGTNMFEFIKYCKENHNIGEINLGSDINTAIENGINFAKTKVPTTNIDNYEKFMEYQRGLSYPPDVNYFVEGFWDAMKDKTGFDILQDQFVVKNYALKARDRLIINGSKYQDAFGKEGSFEISNEELADNDDGKLMTALLTMAYSNFWVADLNEHTAVDIKTGDLIPFLYNIDEIKILSGISEDSHNINSSITELMAKYAYIAYAYGFDVAERTDGFHYWEQEYESVFGDILDLSEEDVAKYQQRYDTMAMLYSDDKGDKGSRLLGATVDTIIKGDYNMQTQLTSVKAKVRNILSGFEIDTTYEDLIAKNYLMVKHMMDNEHIKDTIKDYEVGTIFRNETSLSQGQVDEKNTNTAMLSDFQLVTVSAKSLFVGRIGDTDGDGVSDGEELGPEPNDWSDITSVVKAALKLDTTYGDIPVSQALKWETFNDSINIEWEDASKTKVKKVKAKLYKYRSNPNLKDTDFDGMDDKEEKGKEPLQNNFKGSSMTTPDGNLSIDFNTDFRYLMHNDTKYNDELAQQSLIMANLARGETITLKQKNINYGTMNIKQYMEKLGFKYVDNHEVYNDDNVRVNCYIGYKSIDYYEKKRGVIGVFLNTNESVEAYKKLAVDLDYLRDNNLYEQIAENVYNKIDINKLMNLESEYSLDHCYFISGKGLAGGIASEIAHIIRHEKDTDKDIYCYTFGAPKIHIGVDYTDSFIKNIINEDDYLTKVIPDENGYRNGYTYNASVYSDFIYNYKNLTRNNPKYTGNYMNMNTLNNYVWILYLQIPPIADGLQEDIAKLLSKHISNTNNEEDFNNTLSYNGSYLVGVQMKKQMSNKEIETASSTKAYWTLAKVLEGLDEKTINQRLYKKTKQEANSEIWDYIAFPCYQKKVGIPINNEVPMYFQTNERWSRFRYGRRSNYTDNEGDDNRVMSRNSNYSYATFYEAGCGPSSIAMVLSYLYKKYITPMDVRNRLEDNEVFYRNDANGGSGTIHSVLTDDIPDIFDVNCQGGQLTRTDDNVKSVLKALIEGKPVVALCHGSGHASDHSSFFTTYGHYITIAGVNKEDIAGINVDDIDDYNTTRLNQIRIYVCDSAYYHHRNRNKRTCTTAYRFSDFADKARAGADSFWIYTKDADATYDDDLWDYRNSSYTEIFDPQTYTEYASSGNITINRPYGVFKWEEPTWEFLN